jgi:ketosteroid isomerase-like protein
MPEAELDVVKRLMLAIRLSDLQSVLGLVDQHVLVYPRSEEPGVKEVYEGHEGAFEYLGNWYSQWDDYETEPRSYQEASGGRVLVVMAERGHLKRTGITVDEDFWHSFTVRDARVTEWRMYDSYEQAAEALGLAATGPQDSERGQSPSG